MPRVHHVKRARRDNSAVKKGEEYWWVRHKTGPASGFTVRFARPPKQSELTQSSFYQKIYELAEGIDESDDPEQLQSRLCDELRELADELQGSKDNLPEQLQEAEGGTGGLLTERIEAVESAISDIEGLSVPDEDSEEYEDELSDFVQAISDAINSI